MTLIERLKKEEGERLRIYDDATGKEFRKGDTLIGNLTIGVGINIMVIDRYESNILLEHRLAEARRDAWGVFGYSLFASWPQNRQDVFVDMIYNIGITRFSGFVDMIAAAKAGEWELVKAEMLDSDWARQLPTRAEKLAEMI
jgi:lysozyme